MCFNNEPVHSELYKGYTINIYPDSDVYNPFTDSDGHPPMAVVSFDYGQRQLTEYDNHGSANEIPFLTDEQIRANLAEIISLTDNKNVWTLTENRRDYSGSDISDCINDAITDYVDGLSHSDRLEALATLYNMADIPAVTGSARGYSQGDYWELLVVATPEFQKAMGNPPEYWEKPENLKYAIRLFEDWASGNVYGFEIKDTDDETIDSCWGFFGDYDGEYSALSQAKEQVDWQVEKDRKDRIAQVKTWIRNRVPLNARTFAV